VSDEDDEDEDDEEDAGQAAKTAPKMQRSGSGGQNNRPRASLDIRVVPESQQQERAFYTERNLPSRIATMLFGDMEELREESVPTMKSNITSNLSRPSTSPVHLSESGSFFSKLFGTAFLGRRYN